MNIQPFSINIADEVLVDLHNRLRKTRWPDEIGQPWQYGTDRKWLQQLVHYWLNDFDWRAAEARLNQFPQFMADVEDRKLHFIHARSTHSNALPLVMTHGWPGSVAEFVHIIPMLTQPEQFGAPGAQAFHVVCPSMPGYGFSSPPTAPGFDQKRVAEGHVQLMAALGYQRYVAQGGDWGSPVSSWTAVLAPEQVCALHLTLVFAGYPRHKSDPFAGVTEAEKQILAERKAHMAEGLGYQAIQGTKPQTLGYGLNDSPVGLAAWISEKFHSWSDCHGDIESAVSLDDLLTNIMIYWVTGSATSAARLYYESNHVQNNLFERGKIATPTGCAMFPAELHQPPRAWAEELYNIQHWTRQPKGGHFAALEQPALLAADMRAFFSQFG
ncbi:MAG: alpha/beta fold hydrolase [Pseudomonadales bacterium]|nr:alpha/beta fold hydrolase [Pseudomonadales bacterium]